MSTEKDILIVEPFNGGSHGQLIQLLQSDHEIGERCFVVSLPAKKWHWRARTSALGFSQTIPYSNSYRVLFSSSVLNLAELIALRPDLAQLKKIVYFHENQLVYPVRKMKERDFQYGYNQILTSLVADVVVFNSTFNMDSFLSFISRHLKLIPDHRPKNLEAVIRPKCRVLYFPITINHTSANVIHSFDATSSDIHSVDATSRDIHCIDATSRDIHSVDSTSRDVHSVDATNRDIHSEDATNRDIHSVDATNRDIHSEDATNRDIHSEDATSRDIHSKDATSRDIHSVDATSRDILSVDDTSRDIHFVDTTHRDIHSEDATHRDIHSVDATNREIHSEDATNRDFHSIDATRRDIHSEDATSRDIHSDDAAIRDIHSVNATNRDSFSVDSTNRGIQSFVSRHRDSHSGNPTNRAIYSIDSANRDSHSINLTHRDIHSDNHTKTDIPSVDSTNRFIHPVNTTKIHEENEKSTEQTTGSQADEMFSQILQDSNESSFISANILDNPENNDSFSSRQSHKLQDRIGTVNNEMSKIRNSVGNNNTESSLEKDPHLHCSSRIIEPLKVKETCLHIVWPHRWEHDKDPESFFEALLQLQDEGFDFVVSVIGETFTDVPEIFDSVKPLLADKILAWGFQPRQDYLRIVNSAHVVVSTALHEFFGVAMLEATGHGCYPLCPKQLVYPELYPAECLYATQSQLVKQLKRFCQRPSLAKTDKFKALVEKFSWQNLQGEYRKLLLG